MSRLAGSRAERTFTASAGKRVSVYGIRLPDGGHAAIYLDGRKVATPSFYAPTAARGRVYRSAQLRAGTHTISIRPLGTKPAASSNAWVAIDNVVIGSSVKQETWLEHRFARVSTASAYGGSYDTMTQANGTDTTPAQVQLTFVGPGSRSRHEDACLSPSPRLHRRRAQDDNRPQQTRTSYKALVYSTTFGSGAHAPHRGGRHEDRAKSSVNLDRISID